MKIKVEGNATKTLINKAVVMLKKGEKEYNADCGNTTISVFENQDGSKFASISTVKRVRVGKDRYQSVAGYSATVSIED